tara:strand:- start:139 stop:618 length:480 start_codon:yes stop_codon:yes gene_type:complete
MFWMMDRDSYLDRKQRNKDTREGDKEKLVFCAESTRLQISRRCDELENYLEYCLIVNGLKYEPSTVSVYKVCKKFRIKIYVPEHIEILNNGDVEDKYFFLSCEAQLEAVLINKCTDTDLGINIYDFEFRTKYLDYDNIYQEEVRRAFPSDLRNRLDNIN